MVAPQSQQHQQQIQQQSHQLTTPSIQSQSPQSTPSISIPTTPSSLPSPIEQPHKSNDFLRSSIDGVDAAAAISTNKDLLALHNGAWGGSDNRVEAMTVGQDKIIRAFGELMRNMARMKTFIRPSMCKPYGKQSESLQKS